MFGKMNKQGQVVYVTLLFVALALVLATLYGFTTFNKPVSSLSRDIASAQQRLDVNQQLVIQILNQSAQDAGRKSLSKDAFKTNFVQEMRKRDYSTAGLESIFAAVYQGAFDVEDRGSSYEVTIHDVAVAARNPSISLNRKVTLRVQYIYK